MKDIIKNKFRIIEITILLISVIICISMIIFWKRKEKVVIEKDKVCQSELEKCKNESKMTNTCNNKLSACEHKLKMETMMKKLYSSITTEKDLEGYREKEGLYDVKLKFVCDDYTDPDKIKHDGDACLFNTATGAARYCNTKKDCLGFAVSGSGQYAPVKEMKRNDEHGGSIFGRST